MDIAEKIDLAERRIAASGSTVERWLKDNQIPATTWYRWRRGETSPTFRRWEAIERKLDGLPRVIMPRAVQS